MAPHQPIQRNNPDDPALVVVDRDGNNEEGEDVDEGVSDDEEEHANEGLDDRESEVAEEDADEGLDEDEPDEADEDNSDEMSNDSDESSTGGSNEGRAAADLWDICTQYRSKTLGEDGYYKTWVPMQPKGEVYVSWSADRHNPRSPILDVEIVGVDANGFINVTIRESSEFASNYYYLFGCDQGEDGNRENGRQRNTTPDEDGVYTTMVPVPRDHLATFDWSINRRIVLRIVVKPANDDECFGIVIAEEAQFVANHAIRFKYWFHRCPGIRGLTESIRGDWDQFGDNESNDSDDICSNESDDI